MSKRIESVIDSCTDCRFSKEYQEQHGNTSYVLLCNHAIETANEQGYENIRQTPKSGMFLLAEHRNPIKKDGMHIEIPDECPLEIYETKIPMK